MTNLGAYAIIIIVEGINPPDNVFRVRLSAYYESEVHYDTARYNRDFPGVLLLRDAAPDIKVYRDNHRPSAFHGALPVRILHLAPEMERRKLRIKLRFVRVSGGLYTAKASPSRKRRLFLVLCLSAL